MTKKKKPKPAMKKAKPQQCPKKKDKPQVSEFARLWARAMDRMRSQRLAGILHLFGGR